MPFQGGSIRQYSPLSTAPPAPSRSDVDDKFAAILDRSQTREDVDRWAAQWVVASDPGVTDPAVWWGLEQLIGIDLRHGPGAPYLHDDGQIAGWLAEYRSRCSDRA